MSIPNMGKGEVTMDEDMKECMRLLGIKGLKSTRPQSLFLRAPCSDLLERHPNKSWWFRHKERLRGELLMILKDFDPVTMEEEPEQCREPIPILTEAERTS